MEKLNRIERLALALEEAVGKELAAEIVGDAQGITSSATPSRKAKWFSGFMERMAAHLDEDAQAAIMRGGCCPYRKDWIEDYRKLYAQTYSIDLLLEAMREHTRAMIDRSLDPDLMEKVQFYPFYHSPVRSGSTISIYGFPYHVRDYLQELDPIKRRRHACHCGWISASKENYPLSYCACGTGFYKQVWEGILGQAVEIRPVRSVMHGDDHCQFDVILPERTIMA
jgi:hypothetical protein